VASFLMVSWKKTGYTLFSFREGVKLKMMVGKYAAFSLNNKGASPTPKFQVPSRPGIFGWNLAGVFMKFNQKQSQTSLIPLALFQKNGLEKNENLIIRYMWYKFGKLSGKFEITVSELAEKAVLNVRGGRQFRNTLNGLVKKGLVEKTQGSGKAKSRYFFSFDSLKEEFYGDDRITLVKIPSFLLERNYFIAEDEQLVLQHLYSIENKELSGRKIEKFGNEVIGVAYDKISAILKKLDKKEYLSFSIGKHSYSISINSQEYKTMYSNIVGGKYDIEVMILCRTKPYLEDEIIEMIQYFAQNDRRQKYASILWFR